MRKTHIMIAGIVASILIVGLLFSGERKTTRYKASHLSKLSQLEKSRGTAVRHSLTIPRNGRFELPQLPEGVKVSAITKNYEIVRYDVRPAARSTSKIKALGSVQGDNEPTCWHCYEVNGGLHCFEVKCPFSTVKAPD
jgi:hypothetical protein